MRSIAIVGALAVFAAAPIAAQGKFRTGDINPSRRGPASIPEQVLGSVLGRDTVDTKRQSKSHNVPKGHLPPAGMCRIWIDGVPPGQQPAPTDCQTAVATKPANARVLWGDQNAFPGKANGKFKDKQSKGRNPGALDRDDDRDDGRFGRDDAERRDAKSRGKGALGKSVAKGGKKG